MLDNACKVIYATIRQHSRYSPRTGLFLFTQIGPLLPTKILQARSTPARRLTPREPLKASAGFVL